MLKLRTYQKAITKDLEIEKYTCEHFCFDYKMGKYYIKRTLFPSKTNVNSSVKKQFLVSKRLIQFLNKATFSSFVHDKGTRNLYSFVLKEVQVKYYTYCTHFETVNPNIRRF